MEVRLQENITPYSRLGMVWGEDRDSLASHISYDVQKNLGFNKMDLEFFEGFGEFVEEQLTGRNKGLCDKILAKGFKGNIDTPEYKELLESLSIAMQGREFQAQGKKGTRRLKDIASMNFDNSYDARVLSHLVVSKSITALIDIHDIAESIQDMEPYDVTDYTDKDGDFYGEEYIAEIDEYELENRRTIRDYIQEEVGDAISEEAQKKLENKIYSSVDGVLEKSVFNSILQRNPFVSGLLSSSSLRRDCTDEQIDIAVQSLSKEIQNASVFEYQAILDHADLIAGDEEAHPEYDLREAIDPNYNATEAIDIYLASSFLARFGKEDRELIREEMLKQVEGYAGHEIQAFTSTLVLHANKFNLRGVKEVSKQESAEKIATDLMYKVRNSEIYNARKVMYIENQDFMNLRSGEVADMRGTMGRLLKSSLWQTLIANDQAPEETRVGSFLANTIRARLPGYIKHIMDPKSPIGMRVRRLTTWGAIKFIFSAGKQYLFGTLKQDITNTCAFLRELNYIDIWQTDKFVESSQPRLLKQFIKNGLIRHSMIKLDDKGKPVLENGEIVPSPEVARLILSFVPAFGTMEKSGEFIKLIHQVLDIAKKSGISDLVADFLAEKDPKKRTALQGKILLQVKGKDVVSLKDSLVKISKIMANTQGLKSAITQMVSQEQVQEAQKEEIFELNNIESIHFPYKQSEDFFKLALHHNKGKMIFDETFRVDGKAADQDFMYAKIKGKGALDMADLSGIVSTTRLNWIGVDFEFVNLKDGTVRELELDHARFRSVKIDGLTVKKIDAQNLLIDKKCKIERLSIRGGTLANAIIEADMESSEIRGVDASNITLEKVKISNSDFTGTSFYGGSLYGTTMKNVILDGVDLRRTNISGLKFEGNISFKGIKIEPGDIRKIAFEENSIINLTGTELGTKDIEYLNDLENVTIKIDPIVRAKPKGINSELAKMAKQVTKRIKGVKNGEAPKKKPIQFARKISWERRTRSSSTKSKRGVFK